MLSAAAVQVSVRRALGHDVDRAHLRLEEHVLLRPHARRAPRRAVEQSADLPRLSSSRIRQVVCTRASLRHVP